jgi:hypothetical protein
MTAAQTDSGAPVDTVSSRKKNPYNTRRKSLYFSPVTHSATIVDSATTTTTKSIANSTITTTILPAPTADTSNTSSTISTPPSTKKHPAHHPELNPRSPKRVRRVVHLHGGSLTPPPSPPDTAIAVLATICAPSPDIDATSYDDEFDVLINAIVHVLQSTGNKPISTRGLATTIIENHLCWLPTLNPSNAVNNGITSHIKRRAAEKPPREPILTRLEYTDGRKGTEYYMKYPSLLSSRSTMFVAIKPEDSTRTDRLNVDPGIQYFHEFYNSEDKETNRSPDHPTLFDPPSDRSISPNTDPLLTTAMTVEIDFTTGIKLDYKFYDDTIALENLTPPTEDISSPNSPFSAQSHSSLVNEVDTEQQEPPAPPADEEPDDPQSPHSGAPEQQGTFPTSFFDSPLVCHSMGTQTDEIEMYEDEDTTSSETDQVQSLSSPRTASSYVKPSSNHSLWHEDFTWSEEKRNGTVPSPENTGMDELEEWLQEI